MKFSSSPILSSPSSHRWLRATGTRWDLYVHDLACLNREPTEKNWQRGRETTTETSIPRYLHLGRRFYSRLARFRRKQCASNDLAEKERKRERERKGEREKVVEQSYGAYTFRVFSLGDATSSLVLSICCSTTVSLRVESRSTCTQEFVATCELGFEFLNFRTFEFLNSQILEFPSSHVSNFQFSSFRILEFPSIGVSKLPSF